MIELPGKDCYGKCSRIRAVTFLPPIPDATTGAASITHELSPLMMLKWLYACKIHSEDFLVFLIKELNFAGK